MERKLVVHSGNQAPVTVFTLLEEAARRQEISLHELPSPEVADAIFEAAFLYTQARYCVVDWATVKQWHNERVEICSRAYAGDASGKISQYVFSDDSHTLTD